jgi:hypothetical protein
MLILMQNQEVNQKDILTKTVDDSKRKALPTLNIST